MSSEMYLNSIILISKSYNLNSDNNNFKPEKEGLTHHYYPTKLSYTMRVRTHLVISLASNIAYIVQKPISII